MNRTIGKLAISLVAMLFLVACAAVAPAAAPDVPQAYAKADALVDTAWITANLDDANVRILALNDQETFDQGHLPGAIRFDLRDLTNPDDLTRGQILTQDQLSTIMSSLGIANDDTVVFYDGNSNLLAARAYWALKYYQHEDVRIYNGGLTKWQADGQTLVTDAADSSSAQYVAGAADPAIRTTSEYVLETSGRSIGDDMRYPWARRVRGDGRALRTGRSHSGCHQPRVATRRQRRWHLQSRARVRDTFCHGWLHARQGDPDLLPDRRTRCPYVVRPARTVGLPQRAQL